MLFGSLMALVDGAIQVELQFLSSPLLFLLSLAFTALPVDLSADYVDFLGQSDVQHVSVGEIESVLQSRRRTRRNSQMDSRCVSLSFSLSLSPPSFCMPTLAPAIVVSFHWTSQ